MDNQRYFNACSDSCGNDYNFKNIFIVQEKLCTKYPRLELDGINNLTIRLCLAQHAYCELYKRILGIRQLTDATDRIVFSGTTTSGSCTMQAVPNGKIGSNTDLQLHNAHHFFYLFCTFSVSVLDRLAVEIRECYDLEVPEKKIDWGYFFDPKYIKERNKKLQRVNGKKIYSILMTTNNSFEQLRNMRNTIEHRTFLNITPSQPGKDFDYLIQNSIRLLDFEKTQFIGILNLCNAVYEATYEDNPTSTFIPTVASTTP